MQYNTIHPVYCNEMYNKGYRYFVEPTKKEMQGLYVKSISEIGPLLRDFPNYKFNIQNVKYDWSIAELLDLWKDNELQVIRILANEHPALTATFIVQHAQDGKLSISEANKLANLLTEERQKTIQDD